MAPYPIPSKHVKEAMVAHTNLAVFAGIVALLEGGLLKGDIAAARRIREICLKEQQRQLRLMDKAVAASQAKQAGEVKP